MKTNPISKNINLSRAAESESRPDLESVGVDRFAGDGVETEVGKIPLRLGVPG